MVAKEYLGATSHDPLAFYYRSVNVLSLIQKGNYDMSGTSHKPSQPSVSGLTAYRARMSQLALRPQLLEKGDSNSNIC